MKNFLKKIINKNILKDWCFEEKATAFTEAVILMPVLVSMLMACYDLGQGITTNQKVIGAAQIMGDLIARDRNIDMATLTDIIKAGELSIQPYSIEPFGYDIASIQFDVDGSPIVLWRVTENMEENDAAIDSTEGLGPAGDGVLVVSVAYDFDPFFTNFIVDNIPMLEVSFLRGRRSSTITCSDCPT